MIALIISIIFILVIIFLITICANKNNRFYIIVSLIILSLCSICAGGAIESIRTSMYKENININYCPFCGYKLNN